MTLADSVEQAPHSGRKVVRVVARLNIGGPSLHVVNLCDGLRSRGYESVLVTGAENPDEGSMADLADGHGIEPEVISEIVGKASLGLGDFAAIQKVRGVIRRERPQIVHTHTAKAGFVGRVAAWLCGVPIIVHTYHGHVLEGYFGPFKSRLIRWLERWLARGTHVILAVSERVRDDLVRLKVAPQEKIRVVRLGLDLAAFEACDQWRGEFKRDLGLEDSARLVGIVSRIAPIKNHKLFLRAAAEVADTVGDAIFVVVGDGPGRQELESLAAELGIGDRVVFAGWRRDMPKVFADLDVLVISSDNEGTPVSAIEAMAAGVPVVGTAVGGMPDLIESGVTGYLVPARDSKLLGRAIADVLSSDGALQTITARARGDVMEKYSVARLLEDIDRLYRELLEDRGLA